MNPQERRGRLDRSRLYVVTGARGDLRSFLDAILEAGVDVVQLREKEAEAGELIRLGRVFRRAADAHDALFIVNDHPDVALAVGADGVHLGQNDLPPAVARRILGPDGVVGVSTHSPEQWDRAPQEADYISAGPVWETPTKRGRPAAGLELIGHARDHADRPWFAIGGIDRDNLGLVLEAGARRVAVVRAVTEADDPASAVKHLIDGLSAATS